MWTEHDSDTFIDYGHYFVPDRERQIATLCALIPPRDTPFMVWELGCGEGLLAEAILARFPTATVVGWDGSETMRTRTAERLVRFGERLQTAPFSLADSAWRQSETPVDAIVSSLVIHHLDDAGKAQLYRDLYAQLAPGGVLAIADVVRPADHRANEVAAQQWDDAVQARALALDGTLDAYDYFATNGWNIYRHPDPMDMPSALADHLRWLAEAGFEGADVYWMAAGHAIYGGVKPA